MKVLFLQEYVRDTHIVSDEQGMRADFLSTNLGKKLLKYARSIKLKQEDIYVDYTYDLIPEVMKTDPRTGRVIKYKEPNQTLRKEPERRLTQRIMELKPDIIIPMGNLGCKYTLGVQAITKLRGRPEEVTLKLKDDANNVIAEYPTWVLPIYSMEYITAQPNTERFVQSDMNVLQKFLKSGSEAYVAKDTEYEFVSTIERVREIFNQFKTMRVGLTVPYWLVAWDLETNTLKPELKGAKPLVISLSWDDSQGVTIPLEHKEFSWKPEELAEIYAMIKDFQENKDIIKVGHNIQYDIRFLMSTQGFTDFTQNRDTKIGYYLAISQDSKVSLRLSDLAYEMTDMGGYDNPLEAYKKQYAEKHLEAEKLRVVAEHEQAIKDWELEITEIEEKEKELREQYIKEGRKLSLIPKQKKPPKPKKQAVKPLVNEIDGGDFNYEWIPLEMLHPYASGDVDCCRRIYYTLEPKLKESDRMWSLFTDFYPRLSRALAHIESVGVLANLDYMGNIDREYTKETERLTEEIRKIPIIQEFEQRNQELYEMSIEHFVNTPPQERDKTLVNMRTRFKKNGTKFRPTSSDDKKKVLYDMLGIKLPYDKESIVDTAWDAGIPEQELKWNHYKSNKHNLGLIIEYYEEHRALAKLLLEFSKVNTLKNNFTTKLLEHVSNKDGRVHGSFNPTGTETSRLSSSNPNQQQLPSKVGDPRRFDYSYPIKRMFTTSFKNGALLQLDYQALEMRVVALRAQDTTMTQAFLDGKDLHTNTASIAFNVPESEVSGDMRKRAKGVAFGLVYGETPSSFAPKNDITVEEAEQIFEKFLSSKPMIEQFIQWAHAFVLKHGYVETMQGFRRNLMGAYSKDKRIRNEALRQSVNTIIQGTGAFLTNLSVVFIDEWLTQAGMKSKVVLTVHDSIVIDSPPEEIEIVAKTAKMIMENLPVDFLTVDWIDGTMKRYPIESDVEIGENYNDMVDYNPEELAEFKSVKGYVKYYKDKKTFADYQDNGLISKEDMEKGKAVVEANRPSYLSIA